MGEDRVVVIVGKGDGNGNGNGDGGGGGESGGGGREEGGGDSGGSAGEVMETGRASVEAMASMGARDGGDPRQKKKAGTYKLEEMDQAGHTCELKSREGFK
jgi:hypothetical protein